MKGHFLPIFLLVAMPAFATISQRQSPVSQWNTTASSTCFATLGSTPIATDLFVVWSFWTYTPPNQLTAKVTDSFGNTFVSAVGPTLQTAHAQAFPKGWEPKMPGARMFKRSQILWPFSRCRVGVRRAVEARFHAILCRRCGVRSSRPSPARPPEAR